jgi:hypothetical protein
VAEISRCQRTIVSGLPAAAAPGGRTFEFTVSSARFAQAMRPASPARSGHAPTRNWPLTRAPGGRRHGRRGSRFAPPTGSALAEPDGSSAAGRQYRLRSEARLPMGANEPPADPGMIPLTVPEIKRILASLTSRPPLPPLIIQWDAWTAVTRHEPAGSTSAHTSSATTHRSAVQVRFRASRLLRGLPPVRRGWRHPRISPGRIGFRHPRPCRMLTGPPDQMSARIRPSNLPLSEAGLA